jgi:hypothetical protein
VRRLFGGKSDGLSGCLDLIFADLLAAAVTRDNVDRRTNVVPRRDHCILAAGKFHHWASLLHSARETTATISSGHTNEVYAEESRDLYLRSVPQSPRTTA